MNLTVKAIKWLLWDWNHNLNNFMKQKQTENNLQVGKLNEMFQKQIFW